MFQTKEIMFDIIMKLTHKYPIYYKNDLTIIVPKCEPEQIKIISYNTPNKPEYDSKTFTITNLSDNVSYNLQVIITD